MADPSTNDPDPATPDGGAGQSRRRFLGLALGAAGVAAAGGAGFGVGRATASPAAGDVPAAARPWSPFYGAHQAGIATPAQDRLAFAAFDVTSTDPQDLQVLLGSWAAAAAQMTAGCRSAPSRPRRTARRSTPARRSGSARPNLTVTVGFGPSLFDDRFGLAASPPGRAGRPAGPARRRAAGRAAPAATSACRPAPTTPPSPSTSSATSPGWPAARR